MVLENTGLEKKSYLQGVALVFIAAATGPFINQIFVHKRYTCITYRAKAPPHPRCGGVRGEVRGGERGR